MVKLRNIHRNESWFFYLLFCLSLALTWYFHKDTVRFDDRHELWSDRAGYYIYLPALFYYHFDARSLPPDLDIRTGGGFSIDTLRNKIDTKYTYGVALLASPFFLAAGLVSAIAGYDHEHGFSLIHMRMMSLAAVVYLILGLWLLKRFLDFYFKPLVSYATVALIFAGTNLFYYSLIDGMMSHVYSFFLFALFLFSVKNYLVTKSLRWFILLSVAFSLAVLIRPTNILLGLILLLWDTGSFAGISARTRELLKSPRVFILPAIILPVFLPQLGYWKYLTGGWLHFSYSGEGFTNWRDPRIAEVLFSPVNGLLATTPLVALMLAGTGMMIVRRRPNAGLVGLIFFLVTLVCASWSMWYFGCSYGQRSFIEYYTILAVPFAWLLQWILAPRFAVAKTFVLFLIFLLAYANIRYTVSLYRYDRCYYGSTWDWDHYRRGLERAGIISPLHRMKSFKNDFENLALYPVSKPNMVFTRSGRYSVAADVNGTVTPVYSMMLRDAGYPPPKMVDVSLWWFKPGTRPAGTTLGYAVTRGNEVIFSDEEPVDQVVTDPGTWSEMQRTFIIPDLHDSTLRISLFIRNPGKSMLFADDLLLRFRYRWD